MTTARTARTLSLILLLSGLASCGGKVLEFSPLDAVGDGVLDVQADAGSDQGKDVALDADEDSLADTLSDIEPGDASVPVIDLKKVATFGIASRAGFTSTGVTVVNGDVALFPNAMCMDSTGNAGASQTCLVKTYSSPTGLTVNGSIYFAGDPFDDGATANAVTSDLGVAWVEAIANADTRGPIAGDEMGGMTFLPGVYHNATLGLQASGIATLDAQGDDNAVFLFKVDSSFVDSGTLLLPTRIDLVNGARARNVWFVTGLDITIGSGTIWNGNLLAGRTATVLDGSTVNGRVLAGASGAGAITLTGAASPSVTTITVPE